MHNIEQYLYEPLAAGGNDSDVMSDSTDDDCVEEADLWEGR